MPLESPTARAGTTWAVLRVFWLACLRLTLAGLAAATMNVASGAIDTVDFRVEGTGLTYNEAVNEALTEAISQNSGRSVETATELQRISHSTATESSSTATISDTLAQQIKTATKGEVLSYTVLAKEKDQTGLWTVKLSVTLAKFQRSPQADRLRIAVAGFRPGKAGADFAQLVTAASKSALVQTRKFAVLDRDWEKESDVEEALLSNKPVPREERSRLGQRLGADFVLVGTITDLWVEDNNAPSARLLSIKAKSVVEFRLIDFATGQVKVAKVLNVGLNQAQMWAADRSGQGTTRLVALAARIGNQLSEVITDTAYPITIVAASPGQEVILNQGGDRLKTGARFAVYELGEMLTDPQTGESLGKAEKMVGVIEITRSLPKMSYAKIVEQQSELQKNMILRKHTELGSKENPDHPVTGAEKNKDW
jgi:curli biogenesis system outer membrane secretion channel CsgG